MILFKIISDLMASSFGENCSLFGFILEEDLAAGLLLAALGQHNPETNQQNYFIVTQDTPYKVLKERFMELYFRKDIAIILISTDVEQRLTNILGYATKSIPIILTIPTKKAAMKKAQSAVRRKTEMLADVVAQFSARKQNS